MSKTWTAEDLSEAMLQYSEDQGWRGWNYFAEYLDDQSEVEVGGFGTVVGVEVENGHEGHGEEIWMVFRLGDRYFRIDGAYYSFDGSNWDGKLKEVSRKKKKIYVYE